LEGAEAKTIPTALATVEVQVVEVLMGLLEPELLGKGTMQE
jgi:hypothetical protein